MESSLAFLHPAVLLALLATAPLAFFFRRCGRVRCERLAALGRHGSSHARESSWIVLTIFALGVVGLARPYWGFQDIEEKAGGSDIMLIVDVSRSMLASDVSPNRLGFARREILDILRHVRANRPGDRLGIVLFAGEAYLFCPLTSDYSVARTFAGSISTELITRPGSALNQAIDVALKSISGAGAKDPVLILLSDGEDNTLELDGAVARLEEAGQPLNIIGIGTAEGRPIDLGQGRFVRNAEGRIVISRLMESQLRRMAAATGGIYSAARLDDGDFLPMLDTEGRRGDASDVATGDKRTIRIYNELAPLVFAALLLLLLVAVAKDYRSVIFVLLVLLPRPAVSEEAPAREALERHRTSLRDGWVAYEQGDYEAAKAAFEAELSENPANTEILQALGSAYFRLGDSKKAIQTFEAGVERSASGRERFEMLYDLGNSHFQAQDYVKAISAYEKALTIKPGDEKATFNLELAKKYLAQQQQQQQSKSKDQKKEDQQKQDKDKSSSDSKSKESGGKGGSSGGKEEEGEPREGNDAERPATPKESSEEKKDRGEAEENGSGEQKADQGTSDRGDEERDSGQGSGSAENEEGKHQKSEGGDPAPRQGGEAPTEEKDPAGPPSSGMEKHDPKQLKAVEAKAWLDAMADAPVLMQKRTSRGIPEGGQTW